jgi:hypothetical protein
MKCYKTPGLITCLVILVVAAQPSGRTPRRSDDRTLSVFQVSHAAFRSPCCQRINPYGKKRFAAERIWSPLRFGANIPPFAKMLTWRTQPEEHFLACC